MIITKLMNVSVFLCMPVYRVLDKYSKCKKRYDGINKVNGIDWLKVTE